MQHTVKAARLAEIGARQLANIAHGAACTGRDKVMTMLFPALAAAAKHRMKDFNAQDISNTAWAFAKMSQKNEPLFAALAMAVEPRMK